MIQKDKVLALLRVSSSRQDFTAQQNELLGYLHGLGYQDKNITWLEIKTSATARENSEYTEWLENIKTICLRDNIKTIAVWHLNRLGRREKPLHDMKIWCEENKVNLIARDGNFRLFDDNGDSYMGGMLFNLFMSVIAGDNKERAEKFKRGKDYVRKDGGYTGGKIKFGYMLNAEKKWVINPDEAKIVHLIYDMYDSEKYSCRKLADELTRRGIYRRPGVIWLSTEINRILKSNAYIGEIEKDTANRYPAIISREQFDRVQKLLASNIQMNTRETKYCNFALGLLVCPECGRKYIGSDKQYICITRKCPTHFKEQTKCTSATIKLSLLDAILWQIVRVREIGVLLHGNEQLRGSLTQQLESKQNEISALNKSAEQTATKIETLIDNFIERQLMSQEQFEKRKIKLDTEAQDIQRNIASCEDEINTLKKRIASLTAPQAQKYVQAVEMVDALDWQDIDRDKCREIIRNHVAKISVVENTEMKRSQIVTITLHSGEVIIVKTRTQNNYKNGYITAWLWDADTESYIDWLFVNNEKKISEISGANMWLSDNWDEPLSEIVGAFGADEVNKALGEVLKNLGM